MHRRLPGSLLLVAAVASLATAACADAKPKTPRVVLTGAKGEVVVTVEVRDTPAGRAEGLMHRERLAADRGMLFVFDDEAVRSFWMRNTKISLDLLFLDSRARIVGVIKRAEPQSDESLSVPTPARYVLEVNAGFVDRHQIKTGTRARIEGLATGRTGRERRRPR